MADPAELIAALKTIAAQSSGVPGSTAKADCMAAIASAALRNHEAAALTPQPNAEVLDAETLVNNLLHEVTGGAFLATSRYYELHGAVLARMAVPQGRKLVPVEPTAEGT